MEPPRRHRRDPGRRGGLFGQPFELPAQPSRRRAILPGALGHFRAEGTRRARTQRARGAAQIQKRRIPQAGLAPTGGQVGDDAGQELVRPPFGPGTLDPRPVGDLAVEAGSEAVQRAQPVQRPGAVLLVQPAQDGPHLAGDAMRHGRRQIRRDPRRRLLRPAGAQRQVAAEPVDVRQDGVGAVERRLPRPSGRLHAQPELHGVDPPDVHQIVTVHLLQPGVAVHRAAQARLGGGGVSAADVEPGPGLFEPEPRQVVQLGVVREIRQARGTGFERLPGRPLVAGVRQAHGLPHGIAHRDVAGQPVRIELVGDPRLHALHEQLPGDAGAIARRQGPAGPGGQHGVRKPRSDGDRLRDRAWPGPGACRRTIVAGGGMPGGRRRGLVAELGAAVVRAAVDGGVPVDPHALGAGGLVVEAGVASAEPDGEVDGRARLDPACGDRGEALLPHRRRIEGTGAEHEIVGQVRLEPQRPPVQGAGPRRSRRHRARDRVFERTGLQVGAAHRHRAREQVPVGEGGDVEVVADVGAQHVETHAGHPGAVPAVDQGVRLRVLDRGGEHPYPLRDHEAAGLEPPVPCALHGADHRAAEAGQAEAFADQHVDEARQADVVRLALHHRDPHVVGGGQRPGPGRDGRAFDADHGARALLGRRDGEHPGAGAQVDDEVPRPHRPAQRLDEGAGPYPVRQQVAVEAHHLARPRVEGRHEAHAAGRRLRRLRGQLHESPPRAGPAGARCAPPCSIALRPSASSRNAACI